MITGPVTLAQESADCPVVGLDRLTGLVVVREEGHDLDGLRWLSPECPVKVIDNVATLLFPLAEALFAASHDDAADSSGMIGAVDDHVFGQKSARPDIGEGGNIAV